MASPIKAADPRFVKRERKAIQAGLVTAIKTTIGTRRCFWSWPFGHSYGSVWVWGRLEDVSQCRVCGKPLSFKRLNYYDLMGLADDVGVPEAVREPLCERWRQIGGPSE